MLFGSKCVKVAKMCILHIYTRADVNTLMVILVTLISEYDSYYLLIEPWDNPIRNKNGNFVPAPLNPPFPILPYVGFSRPVKVVGREWGKILTLHYEAGRGWV